MLDRGRTVVNRSRGGDQAAAALVTQWFGTANQVTLSTKIETLLTSILTGCVGVCYMGNGVQAAGAYCESGLRQTAVQLSNFPTGTEVGFAQPGGGRAIGFFNRFFPGNTAVARRTTAHTPTATALGCSRAGAVVHELSHVFLNTLDVVLPTATCAHLNMAPPAQGAPTIKAYAPKACTALAATRPDLAMDNADTYRLFCEDAQVMVG